MAPIVVSVEISRRPEDVFADATDPSHLLWQASAVKVQADDAPTKVGTKAVVTRRAGPREMAMTVEVDEYNPSTSSGVCEASTARFAETSKGALSRWTTEPDLA